MSDRPGLLITRPATTAAAFAQDVQAQMGSDVDIVISPILTISSIPLTLDVKQYPTLIFTSAHAVRAVASSTKQRDFICYAVGGATSDCAAREGFNVREGGGTGDALARRIIGDRPSAPCLYLRGKHIAYDLAGTLSSAGIETQEMVVYDQQETDLNPEAIDFLASGRPVILPLFSARSATLFFDRYTATGPLDVVAMSRKIAATIPPSSVRHLRVCARPTAEAMVSETAILLRGTNQLEGRPSPK